MKTTQSPYVAMMCSRVSVLELHRYLVDETPAPVFTALERGDDGVFGSVKVLGGVPVLRVVATPDVPASPA
jgi:hypothetical protein